MNKAVIWLVVLWPVASSLCVEGADSTETVPDYFSRKNILRFADHLYTDGDYLRAAGEYQRYLFSQPTAAGSDSIFYRMINAVFHGEDYERSDRLLGELSRRYPESPLTARVPLARSVVTFRQGDYAGSIALAQAPDVKDSDLARTIIALGYLHLGEFEKAQEWSCVPAGSASSTTAHGPPADGIDLAYLCQEARSASSLPWKSRLRAGMYSTLIPGAGKIYTGRTADGIYSLVIIGLLAWQAYDGFEEDGVESVKGWVFGISGAMLYLSNIYGSVKAAEVHNRRVHHDFLEQIQVDVTLP